MFINRWKKSIKLSTFYQNCWKENKFVVWYKPLLVSDNINNGKAFFHNITIMSNYNILFHSSDMLFNV